MPCQQSVQVEALIPDDQPEGETLVRARLSKGEPSNQVSISMPPPRLKVPDIHLVTNVPDGGTDLYARGPKSKIRLLVRDLIGPVNPDDLMVFVNGANLEPESVEFIPSNAAWLITVQLTNVEAGPAEIQLIHKSNGSAAYQVELLAT